MKKAMLLPLLLILFYHKVSAVKLPLPYCSGCEYVEYVKDLPDHQDLFVEEYGSFADLGYTYKQFWILWLPIWNYEGRYILTIKHRDVAYDLHEADLDELRSTYGLDLGSSPLSLWSKIGGKMIILSLLTTIIWLIFTKPEPAIEDKGVSSFK